MKLRYFSIDALRGLLIILMALDHANHFIAQRHSTGEYWGGTFPSYHSSLDFLTRFVTHIAAPGFFFLMGIGMKLFSNYRIEKSWNNFKIMKHFWLRGGMLIVIQLLIVNRAWELSPGGWSASFYVGVLIALGMAMILGSFLLKFPPGALLVITLTLLMGTELLTPNPLLWSQFFHPVTRILFVPGGTLKLWVNYPILPWLELTIFGIIYGNWLLNDDQKVFERGLILGIALLTAFIPLRYLDGFGNIRSRQGDSWIDFLNLVKYPPSITFTFLTTGINLILLGLLSKASDFAQKILYPLVVFGRVPLFFYIIHLFTYLAIGRLFFPNGTSFQRMYLYWIFGLILLYPLCLVFGRFKHRQSVSSFLRFI